jgi:hypothetical protein
MPSLAHALATLCLLCVATSAGQQGACLCPLDQTCASIRCSMPVLVRSVGPGKCRSGGRAFAGRVAKYSKQRVADFALRGGGQSAPHLNLSDDIILAACEDFLAGPTGAECAWGADELAMLVRRALANSEPEGALWDLLGAAGLDLIQTALDSRRQGARCNSLRARDLGGVASAGHV